MYLRDLYLYFSQFVSATALNKNVIAQRGGTSTPISESRALYGDNNRFSEINDYIFIGDSDNVLERLRNSDVLLFVDSDRIFFLPNMDGGISLSLGVTVAEHYASPNSDVMSELELQDRCLDRLRVIIGQVVHDSEYGCPLKLHLENTPELRALSAKQLNGLIGYTAFFTISCAEYGTVA